MGILEKMHHILENKKKVFIIIRFSLFSPLVLLQYWYLLDDTLGMCLKYTCCHVCYASQTGIGALGGRARERRGEAVLGVERQS